MTNRGLPAPRGLILGAFLLCFFAAGIPFWRIPYSQVNLPDGFYGIGVVVVFCVAGLLCFTARVSFGRTLVLTGLAIPAALMARVIAEGLVDPTRHNLWPLALVIAVVFGTVVSGGGALTGWIAGRLWR